MLIAAIAALWAALMLIAREMRSLWMWVLEDQRQRILALEAEARATMKAKDQEINELWRMVQAVPGSPERYPPHQAP